MCNWNSSSEKVLRIYVVQPFRSQCIYEIRISYNTLFPRGRIYGPRNQWVGIGLAIIFSDSLADFASSHKLLALRDGSSKPKNRYILLRQHRIVPLAPVKQTVTSESVGLLTDHSFSLWIYNWDWYTW